MKKKLMVPIITASLAVSMIVPAAASSQVTFIVEEEVAETLSGNEAEAVEDEKVDVADEAAGYEDTETVAVEIEDRFDDDTDLVIVDDLDKVILPNIKKEGYTLKGWSNSLDDDGTMYDVGEEYEIGTDEDIYTVWEENEYVFTLTSEADGEKTEKELRLKNTETGMFEDPIEIKKDMHIDVSAENIGLEMEVAGNDYKYKIFPSDVSSAVLEDEDTVIPSVLEGDVYESFIVTYTAEAYEDEELVTSSKVDVMFTFIEEEVKDNKKADETSEDAKEEDEEKPAEEKSEAKDAKINYIPTVTGTEYEASPFAVKEMTEISTIVPEIEGFVFDHAVINKIEVVMIDKASYFDGDKWIDVDKDVPIELVYIKK